MTLLGESLEFATAAHLGQTRKYTEEPYIEHCRRVSQWSMHYASPFVSGHHHLPRIGSKALLHDTIEDTSIVYDDVLELSDKWIANDVSMLTQLGAGATREIREAVYREQIGKSSWEVKLIKSCDMIDNLSDIADHDPKFAKRYVREKVEMIPYVYCLQSSEAIQHLMNIIRNIYIKLDIR